MNKVTAGALALAVAVATAGSAQAATLIDGGTQGLYNSGLGVALDGSNPLGGGLSMFPLANVAAGDPVLDIPAGTPPDLSIVSSELGNWLTDPANPGGTWSAGNVAIPATWAVNTETAIIYELDGGATGLSNVMASFGVDNGIFVWLNGTFLGGHLRPGGVTPGEFSLNIGNVGAGMNFLQILREDHGGGTGYSVSVTGDAAQVGVIPLPAAGWLLLAGLGGMAALRRRQG